MPDILVPVRPLWVSVNTLLATLSLQVPLAGLMCRVDNSMLTFLLEFRLRMTLLGRRLVRMAGPL